MREIYLDSSVFGYAANARAGDKYADANVLLSQIANGRFDAYISEVVFEEIGRAPDWLADTIMSKVESVISVLEVNDNVLNTARELTAERIILMTSFEDAMHLAFTIDNGLDTLISYNFKHLVKLEVEIAVHKFLSNKDLPLVYLNTPAEVIIYE